jgi:predicted porin
MMMKSNVAMVSLLCGAVLAGGAAAEGLYGTGDLLASQQSLQSVSMGPISSDESGLIASGSLGYRFGSGLFIEGELRFQDYSDDDADSIDPLQNSSLSLMRAGIDRGTFTAEALIGAASVRTDDGDSGLTFAGLGGSYGLSDQATLRGMVIHLAHESGEEAEDVLSDATAFSLGAAYQVSDQVSVWGDAVYADGVMDSDRDMGLVREISIGADYAFLTPGLKAYGAVSYADIYQGGEQQNAYDTRVALGISYSFGAAGSRDLRKRAPLPNIENWMAITSSILE